MKVNTYNESLLSAFMVRQLFSYDPDTGLLYWKRLSHRKSNRLVGAEAGTAHDKGYRMVTIHKRRYFVHRVIWLYVTGEWPKNFVDHEDGITSRNAWSNLREATTVQNGHNLKCYKNNTSGHPGVRCRPGGQWQARIRENHRDYVIGTFPTLAEAVAARTAAKARLHPFQPFDRA